MEIVKCEKHSEGYDRQKGCRKCLNEDLIKERKMKWAEQEAKKIKKGDCKWCNKLIPSFKTVCMKCRCENARKRFLTEKHNGKSGENGK